MRKTKIVCTLGPATDDVRVLEKMIENGMDVARMNFSHGTHLDHKRRIDAVKDLRERLKRPIAVMLDTKGPEIRIGTFKNGRAFLRPGQMFTLTADNIEGDEYRVTVGFKELPRAVKKGDRLLFSDGLIESEVTETDERSVTVLIKNGGTLGDRKSINLPDTKTNMPYMNEADMEDIRFGAANGVDYIAASFVRSASDVRELKSFMHSVNPSFNARIISKIENEEGVANISEIIDVSDGVMIARGDMGVEIEFERLPEIQKKIIKKCLGKGKISITATQMLESMISNPRPTRAEVTDIANAIYDGTSAIMLSGETAAGKYPAESVATMAKIAETTESVINYKKRFLNSAISRSSVTDAIGHATMSAAMDLNASAIVAVTQSGHTAYSVSGFRPFCPVAAVTPDFTVYNQLALSWGVMPLCVPRINESDDMFFTALDSLKSSGILKAGDTAVVTGNSAPSGSGTTNLLRVHTVGGD